MTPTTAAAHIGEVWVPEVIRAQEFGLEMAPRVFRDWTYKGYGDVYHIPRSGNMEVATKTAGNAWTPYVYTDTEQTITINVQQVTGFQIEDITALLSNTDLKSEKQRNLGYSLGRAVEVNLATLPQNFSQSVGSLGSEPGYDECVAAWRLMALFGIKLQDQCTWFFSPETCAGLLKQEIIVNRDYRSPGKEGKAVEQAMIGDILGAPVVQTNLLRSPSAGQHENFLMYRKGIALIMAMQPKVVTEYIAKELSWVVGSHQIYGYGEVTRYDETPGNVTAVDKWLVLVNGV